MGPIKRLKSHLEKYKATEEWNPRKFQAPRASGSATTPTARETRDAAAASVWSAATMSDAVPKPNDEFHALLDSSVQSLQNDFTSGARQMADAALSNLSTLIELAAATARNQEELWKMAVLAAEQLSEARPSMSAAIKAGLLRALAKIQSTWASEVLKEQKEPTALSRVAGYVVEASFRERQASTVKLGKAFANWVVQAANEVKGNRASKSKSNWLAYLLQSALFDVHEMMVQLSEKRPPSEPQTTVRILTLSNSSSIRTALLAVLDSASDLSLEVTVLESRPRFEGADMAAQVLAAAKNKKRIKVRMAVDCAVASIAKKVDIVLLGADQISSSGDVSNKIGSLAAAVCAKSLNKRVQVVVVSEGDKIVAPDAGHGPVEEHPASETTEAWKRETRESLDADEVEVHGEWFEWVPAGLVDVYVTEAGVLDKAGVEKVAKDVAVLEKKIFQGV